MGESTHFRSLSVRATDAKYEEDDGVLAFDVLKARGQGVAAPIFDATNATLGDGQNAFKAGSFGTPMPLGGTTDVLASIHAESAGNDAGGFDYTVFSSMKGAESDDNLIGIHNTTHATASGASYPKTVQAIQGHAQLEDGAKLATRGGDGTAGLYAGWFKVFSGNSSVLDSGSYTAAIFLDNQHSANTMNGTEYTIFSATGASKPDAWAGFDTSSSGWDSLFLFEDDNNPVGATSLVDGPTGGTQGKTVKCVVNGTTYYLILWAAA